MQVLSSLRKRTKTGVSTWTFIHDREMKVFYAVGGEDLKVIPANDREHLRSIYNNFVSWLYTQIVEKSVDKQQFIEDPWSSQLPARCDGVRSSFSLKALCRLSPAIRFIAHFGHCKFTE